jgi:hypothetical protein
MNEFERARSQIEKILKEAENRRALAEESERQSRENERRAVREAEARKQAVEAHWQAVRGSATAILQNINREIFDGNGAVSGWVENLSAEHVHTYSTWYSDDIGGRYEDRTYSHKAKVLESTLAIANLGYVAVYIPLQTMIKDYQYGKYVWEPPTYLPLEKLHITSWMISEQDYLCHEIGTEIPFDLPESEILERLQQVALEKVIDLYRRAHSL